MFLGFGKASKKHPSLEGKKIVRPKIAPPPQKKKKKKRKYQQNQVQPKIFKRSVFSSPRPEETPHPKPGLLLFGRGHLAVQGFQHLVSPLRAGWLFGSGFRVRKRVQKATRRLQTRVIFMINQNRILNTIKTRVDHVQVVQILGSQ